MPFNLLRDSWLPVRRLSGRADRIAPHDIAGGAEDPVVALDWPRPDFRFACLELLIGLLATACPPADDVAWQDWFHAPPAPDTLRAAFAKLADAFTLDGDGPRFMQDFEDIPGEAGGVETLLIEAPGEATVKKNTDLLVRRGRAETLSRAAAAMALFTLQTYAPSGGAGNRTSLRGGGPLTTLVIPPPPRAGPATLWHMLWANVPAGPTPAAAELKRVFPWLVPTRVSDKGGRATTPADVHPLQAFWGMPRRIRLDIVANAAGAPCDLTGWADEHVVRGWRQRPWGTNYETWGGIHNLSPCYRMKAGAELLYLHPQPGGIGYQHWQGLLSRNPPQTMRVAPAVETFRTIRLPDGEDRLQPRPWRLLAGGFDMDNMKARGFTESEIPVHEPADPKAAGEVDEETGRLVEASRLVAQMLRNAVKDALFAPGAKVDADAAMLSALRERFWVETADDFFVQAAALAGGQDVADIRAAWQRVLAATARRLFAEAAPIDASGEGHPGRIAAAARRLSFALHGYGKQGTELFSALRLELPEKATTKKGKRA